MVNWGFGKNTAPFYHAADPAHCAPTPFSSNESEPALYCGSRDPRSFDEMSRAMHVVLGQPSHDGVSLRLRGIVGKGFLTRLPVRLPVTGQLNLDTEGVSALTSGRKDWDRGVNAAIESDSVKMTVTRAWGAIRSDVFLSMDPRSVVVGAARIPSATERLASGPDSVTLRLNYVDKVATASVSLPLPVGLGGRGTDFPVGAPLFSAGLQAQWRLDSGALPAVLQWRLRGSRLAGANAERTESVLVQGTSDGALRVTALAAFGTSAAVAISFDNYGGGAAAALADAAAAAAAAGDSTTPAAGGASPSSSSSSSSSSPSSSSSSSPSAESAGSADAADSAPAESAAESDAGSKKPKAAAASARTTRARTPGLTAGALISLPARYSIGGAAPGTDPDHRMPLPIDDAWTLAVQSGRPEPAVVSARRALKVGSCDGPAAPVVGAARTPFVRITSDAEERLAITAVAPFRLGGIENASLGATVAIKTGGRPPRMGLAFTVEDYETGK